MKLKICGMKYSDNIMEVAKLSPDFMGFIFYPKSKRFIGNDFVMPEISSLIKKVGVFVNDTIENIFDKVEKYSLDYVQLHGEESAEFCKSLSISVKIIKAFGVNEQFYFPSLNEYDTSCEYFLFDTKTNEYGGSGRPFDRTILNNYNLSKSYFLSGGIDSAEVGVLKPFAIDANSKFETELGFKDIDKLKILITSLHRTQ